MRTGHHIAVGVLAAIAGLALADAADAELYRCRRPDGSVVYTDSQATCPGAREHRPSGSLQSVGPSLPDRAQPAERGPVGRAAARAPDDATAEAAWRRKKQQARRELAAVEQRRESLLPHLTHCNRGGELFRRLPSGLKTGVSCDAVRSEAEKLDSRRDELSEYLERGIHEACRRAGCLPGWVR